MENALSRALELFIGVISVAATLFVYYKKTKKERDLSNQLQTDKILASMKEQQEKELKAIEAQNKERERLDGINAEQDKRTLLLEYEIKETKRELATINDQLQHVTATLESMHQDMHSITLTIQKLVNRAPARRKNAGPNPT